MNITILSEKLKLKLLFEYFITVDIQNVNYSKVFKMKKLA